MAESHRAGVTLLRALAGFGRELRAAGLTVGTGQVVAFCRALACFDPADLRDVYWSGRACLVSRCDDLPAYDAAFTRYFLATDGRPRVVAPAAGDLPDHVVRRSMELAAPVTDGEQRQCGDGSGRVASDVEVLRDKDFADCDPDELDALGRLMAGLDVAIPMRRVRRTERARRGPRRDLRRALRGDLVVSNAWRRHRRRPRDLVLLLDVSGSMAPYSRVLLQFAFAIAHGPGQVEVFSFATRLTRVSGALARLDPDEALRRAAETVLDWDGGTRIGDSVQEYLRTWAWRAGCRGAVVVVCSDGLERGDPEVLAAAMACLARLAH